MGCSFLYYIGSLLDHQRTQLCYSNGNLFNQWSLFDGIPKLVVWVIILYLTMKDEPLQVSLATQVKPKLTKSVKLHSSRSAPLGSTSQQNICVPVARLLRSSTFFLIHHVKDGNRRQHPHHWRGTLFSSTVSPTTTLKQQQTHLNWPTALSPFFLLHLTVTCWDMKPWRKWALLTSLSWVLKALVLKLVSWKQNDLTWTDDSSLPQPKTLFLLVSRVLLFMIRPLLASLIFRHRWRYRYHCLDGLFLLHYDAYSSTWDKMKLANPVLKSLNPALQNWINMCQCMSLKMIWMKKHWNDSRWL